MILAADVDIDETLVEVDLNLVTGWDALTYQSETGVPLEQAIAVLLAKQADGGIVLAADRAIVRWLHLRVGDPDVTLRSAALTVRAIPSPDDGD